MGKILSRVLIISITLWLVMLNITKAADYSAVCSPSSGDVIRYQGQTVNVSLGGSIPCEEGPICAGVTFTAKMKTNIFFGPEHVYDSFYVNPGISVNRRATEDTSGLKGTDRIIIEVTSNQTGSTVLAECNFRLTVLPAEPIAVIFCRPKVEVGHIAEGWVILSDPAPPGGAVVSLSSSKPTLASVPESIKISHGTRSGMFEVHTSEGACAKLIKIIARREQAAAIASLELLSEFNPPAKPTGFAMRPFKKGHILLKWDSMEDVDKFIIQRKKTDTGSISRWEVQGGTKTYFPPRQTPCVRYQYRLYAISHLCQSPPAGSLYALYDNGSCPW